jgi:pyrroloquinoline-quinone synthase
VGPNEGRLVHTIAASLGSEEIKAAKKEIVNHGQSLLRLCVVVKLFFNSLPGAGNRLAQKNALCKDTGAPITPFPMQAADLLGLIDEKHLLKHPFYQAWTEGTLPIEVMRKYAEQYYHLERNFPNFLSAMLMTCDDEGIRAKILENFRDETSGSMNHRELWLQFGEAIGVTREDMKNSEMLPETAEAIATFSRICSSNYLQGAGALAAYESQIPAIAAKKMEGLEKNYGVTEGIEFFRVHGVMDVHHAQVWWDMLKGHEEEVAASVKAGRDALWNFLNGVLKAYKPEMLEMSC